MKKISINRILTRTCVLLLGTLLLSACRPVNPITPLASTATANAPVQNTPSRPPTQPEPTSAAELSTVTPGSQLEPAATRITLTFLTPKPKKDNAQQMEGYTFKPPPQFVAIAQIEASSLPPPPENHAYLVWLIAEDESVKLLGTLEPNAQGNARLQWQAPEGENLLTHYIGARITLENTRNAQAPSGTTRYENRLTPANLAIARRLFISNSSEPITPLDTSFVLGLYEQTDLALQHVQNAINAAAIGARSETRTHLEHVINILEGVQGARYGDYTGDGVAQNPGDGFGARGYIEQTILLLQAANIPFDNPAIQTDLQNLQDLCVEILRMEAGNMQAIQNRLKDLKAQSLAFQNGSIAELETTAYQLLQIPLLEP